jgi:hypothetical protein
MSLLIYSEKYHDQNFLSTNVGDWVYTEFEFIHRVDYEANDGQSKINFRSVGGVFWWELTNGNGWQDYGFVGGKTIETTYTIDGFPPQTVSTTIQYIDGEKMYLNTDPYGGVFSDGASLPGYDSDTGEVAVVGEFIQTDAPESVEYDFNLAEINNPSLNSLIDGGINRFKYDDLTGLVLAGSPGTMYSVGNKSGGYFSEPKLYYLDNVDGYRKYKITFFFFCWPLIQDNQLEPQWFDGVDTLGPNHRIRVFSELGNANSILQDKSTNTDGNVGGFNENYNTSINPYTLNNVIFTDLAANVVEGVDYVATTHVKATLTGSTFSPANSKFNYGLVWRSNDAENYQNKLTNLGKNLFVNAPIHEFIDTVAPDPSAYGGNFEPTTGASWVFENVHFYLVGTLLTFEADIVPNSNNSLLFDDLDDGAKRCTLWISHNRTDLDAIDRDRVSLKLYDTDVIKSPAIGDPIELVTESFTDHGGNDLPAGETTTEDDVLYTLDFRLPEGQQYTGLRTSIQMYNTVTEEFFTLEDFFFGFASIPFIGGIYQANNQLNRTFNLPPTTDRGAIKLNRLPTSDAVGNYALRLEYGFLNLWQYWNVLTNADTDFFDLLQPNNGLNKFW